ncbi:Zn-dependent hydrolase [Pseudobacillus wudalianchiensis]|uniref:Zn-dependent hydrolase n=1 Tax=Pseudobacillus wudalianchiensis TaxID=1743143 RepID=A0A1B9AEB3_9BACI|nr:Zn-dependent hydrolase [Bacillus wudalianchiensis]OCA82170.1 Zn-dependent hydrolase [Bacillus wudalianchiensis]
MEKSEIQFKSFNLSINAERLFSRLTKLGQIGRDGDGKLTRLAATDTDKAGRDAVVVWMKEAGLEIAIDRIGNIFGIWRSPDAEDQAPILMGSHIDTVINAGIYDGCYGVLAGIEVIKTLREAGVVPSRPIAVAAFTNEEGVRYAPDMMGSLVFAGGLPVEEALATVGIDGTLLGAELERIGYAGTEDPGFLQPHAYVELHIEQGPVLERMGISIGAVENLQGISWQRITIEGVANHAGTTPMAMRRDAGHAAARVVTFLHDRAISSTTPTVATVGCLHFEPSAINVIPSRATFTVDLRDPNEQRLKDEEAALADYLEKLAAAEEVCITAERLARFEPVIFDDNIAELVECAADRRGLSSKRMTSGAGHDAQMIARICPTAMVFVPSVGGISHNPREYTSESDLVAGANVLLDVVSRLAGVL